MTLDPDRFRWGEPYAYGAFADYAQGIRQGHRLTPDRWSLRDDGTVRCRTTDDRVVYVPPGLLRPLKGEEGDDTP